MRARVGDWDPVLLDRTVGANQRRGANRSFDDFTLGILARAPSAVGSHDLNLRIGQERERQIELGNELIVRIDTVSTDPQDHRIGLRHVLNSVAEPARFFGSAGGIVLGIKPEDDVLAGVIRQRMLFAVATR